MKFSRYTPEKAEFLALQAVSFLASDDDRIGRFMSISGMSPDSLMQTIGDTTVLAGVLDYILSDDSLLIEFSEFAEIAPEVPALARASLPGFVQT